MTDILPANSPDPLIHAAGGFAIASGFISALGVIFLIAMFVLFATSHQEQGMLAGLINDILIAVQYLLAIPIALALFRLLQPQESRLILAATIIGMASMVVVILLQLLLVFEVLTFQQQGLWVSLAMLLGVGSWLVITGLALRSIEGFPHSLGMGAAGATYLGYPVWAFWLGKCLLGL